MKATDMPLQMGHVLCVKLN